jgi:hypothetical protein
VRNGGNLISTFETSSFDEAGNKLEFPSLGDVFGTDRQGELFGPLNWDYLAPGKEGHFALRNITNRFVNAPEYGIRLLTSDHAALYFCKPLPGSYAGSPELTGYPFMIENTFGKGRSVYMAGTFGASLLRYHFPEYYTILSNLALELSKPPLILENAPSSVEVNIRRKSSSLYIYLINFTSEMKRPIERIIPVHDLVVTIRSVPGIRSVKSLWNGNTPDFSWSGDDIRISVPLLKDYDVIELRS